MPGTAISLRKTTPVLVWCALFLLGGFSHAYANRGEKEGFYQTIQLLPPAELKDLEGEQATRYFHSFQGLITALENSRAIEHGKKSKRKVSKLEQLWERYVEAALEAGYGDLVEGAPCVIGGWSSTWHNYKNHWWCGLSPEERSQKTSSAGGFDVSKPLEAQAKSIGCGSDGQNTRCNPIPYLLGEDGNPHCVKTTPTLSTACGAEYDRLYGGNPEALKAGVTKLLNGSVTEQSVNELQAKINVQWNTLNEQYQKGNLDHTQYLAVVTALQRFWDVTAQVKAHGSPPPVAQTAAPAKKLAAPSALPTQTAPVIPVTTSPLEPLNGATPKTGASAVAVNSVRKGDPNKVRAFQMDDGSVITAEDLARICKGTTWAQGLGEDVESWFNSVVDKLNKAVTSVPKPVSRNGTPVCEDEVREVAVYKVMNPKTKQLESCVNTTHITLGSDNTPFGCDLFLGESAQQSAQRRKLNAGELFYADVDDGLYQAKYFDGKETVMRTCGSYTFIEKAVGSCLGFVGESRADAYHRWTGHHYTGNDGDDAEDGGVRYYGWPKPPPASMKVRACDGGSFQDASKPFTSAGESSIKRSYTMPGGREREFGGGG